MIIYKIMGLRGAMPSPPPTIGLTESLQKFHELTATKYVVLDLLLILREMWAWSKIFTHSYVLSP